MKIRWTKQSLRFRITPAELEQLAGFQEVFEAIEFPGQVFWRASLLPVRSETRIVAATNDVVVHLSDLDIAHLCSDDVEGIYFNTPDETGLKFLVEKDFPCVHPRPSKALEPLTETFNPPEGFDERNKSYA